MCQTRGVKWGLIVVAGVLASCGKTGAGSKAVPSPSPSTSGSTSTGTGTGTGTSGSGSPIGADTLQLVVGIGADWDATQIELSWYTRVAGGPWRLRAHWPGGVGYAGLAGGRGLHGVGAPPGAPVSDPLKVEGDGRAPAGAFSILTGFGTTAPPAGLRWSWLAATPTLRCVDDPRSSHYNQLVDESRVPADWSSAEDMLRSDELHARGLVVGHNTSATTPGAGSCIFFHVWTGAGSATVGCTALAHDALAELLAGLEPAAHPVYVLLPQRSHQALRAAWALP